MSDLVTTVMEKIHPLTVGLKLPDEEGKPANVKFAAEVDRRAEEVYALKEKLSRKVSQLKRVASGKKQELEDAEMDVNLDPEVKDLKPADVRKLEVRKRTAAKRDAYLSAAQEVDDHNDALGLVEIAKSRLRFAKELLATVANL